MGFDINGYSRHLSKDGLGEEEHKISGEQRKINLVDIKDVIAGIKIATAQWEKDTSKDKLKYKNKEVSNKKSNNEELADIVPFIKGKIKDEEEKLNTNETAEIVSFRRNNIESINRRENQRASGGEER